MDAVPIVPPLFQGTKNTTLHELQTGDTSCATDPRTISPESRSDPFSVGPRLGTAFPNLQSPAGGKLAGDASPSAECHLIAASGEPRPASAGTARRRAERRPSSGRAH